MSAFEIFFAVLLMAALDNAAWQYFVAVAGSGAIFYMFFLVVLEVYAISKNVSSNPPGL